MSLSTMLKVTCSAPGKIILSGEHSVVYPGKPAIAASISKRCSCHLLITREKTVTIELNSLNVTRTLSLDEIVKEIKHKKESAVNNAGLEKIAGECTSALLQIYSSDADSFAMKNALHVILFLLTSILCQIDKDHLSKCTGLILTVNSDLILGAGSGSSAAFAVSVAGSVYTYLRWLLCCPNGHNDGTVVLEKQGYKIENSWDTITSEDLELINSMAYLAEKITHGTPSGLDNTICTYGGVVKLKRYDTGNQIDKIQATLPLELLLIDTGVSRSTSNLVAKVAALKIRHEEIFDQLLTALGSVTESFLDVLKSLSEIDPSDGGDKMRSEFQKLEDLIDINQGLLTSLGVSHPSLNQIIDICKSNGLHAKLTGAGGGGYAFAVIPPAFEKQSVDKCVDQLERAKFNVYRGLKLGGPGFELKVEKEVDVGAV